jgi:probable F420-dependent oxidoreductase
MSNSRPFRFSVSLGATGDPSELIASARRAESLGYSGVVLPDHLDGQVGPLVGLTAIASATTDLRLITLVLANDYRHPAVLAKELASLDFLSGGRLEVGIGAGWMTSDYERAGIRIERLAEAIDVLKGCFADGPFDFAGDHYRITGLDSQPKPVQRPHPPLVVAGGGPRILGLAARTADVVGINPDLGAGVIGPDAGPSATAEATDEKVALVREAAGDRFETIELHSRVHLATIDSDPGALAEALAPAFGLTGEQALASPHALVGTVDQCVESLLERRERWGFSHMTWGADAMETMAPVVERLAWS